MSLQDDHASPAAPFYGDSTGEIFDTPDLVLQSPTTTDRVVDTQSGFLVVVKQLGSRSALSVKRRLGTPPVSSILLTPDETLRLSRALAGLGIEGDDTKRTETSHVTSNVSDLSRRFIGPHTEKEAAAQEKTPSADGEQNSQIKPKTPTVSRFISSNSGLKKGFDERAILLSLIFIVALTAGMLLASHWRARQHRKPVVQETKIVEPKGPTEQDIDKFVRNYVSNMLDFNPESYKFSQIRAMSVMTPQLMSQYWRETNFPIADKQLKTNLKRQTLEITKVTQEEAADKSGKVVDVYAQLNGPDGKSSVNTHLQLNLAIAPSESEPIRVTEQNDLTASDK